MIKEDKIIFSLQNIKNEQFAIIEKNYKEKEPVEITTGVQFMIDSKNHVLGSLVNIAFEQSKRIFLKIDVSCHFNIEIKSWNKFINKKESIMTIPKGFLAHMATITVGTSRGILFSKTDGTIFNKFIIPTINIAEMITKDATFPVEK